MDEVGCDGEIFLPLISGHYAVFACQENAIILLGASRDCGCDPVTRRLCQDCYPPTIMDGICYDCGKYARVLLSEPVTIP